MTMTNEEIVRSYKNAKNPSQQVQNLAELNGCSKKEISRILSEAGIDLMAHKRGPKPSPKTPKVNVMGVLKQEERALEARRDEITATIPKLEAEMESIAEKLAAVESARAALAVVYGAV